MASNLASAWFARTRKNALTIKEMCDSLPREVGTSIGLNFDEINDEMPRLDELSDGCINYRLRADLNLQ